jgi:hypothetical protein
MYGYYLIILAPGVVAFRAPEEPHLAFISGAELAEPPDSKVVPALRTLDLDGGHGFYFIILIINNHYIVLCADFFCFHLVISTNLADISAFPAFQLTGR